MQNVACIDCIVFHVGLGNEGSVDVMVNINVLIPASFSYVGPCEADGSDFYVKTPLSTSESLMRNADGQEVPSVYWATSTSGARLPAETALPLFFRAGPKPLAPFPVKVKVWAVGLPTVTETVILQPPEAT